MASGKETKIFDAKTTTDSYADSLIIDFLNYSKAQIWIKNTGGTNSLKYIVYGRASRQDTDADWEIEVAEATLTFGVAAKHEITDAYATLKVTIKAASAGNQTTCDSFVIKKRR